MLLNDVVMGRVVKLTWTDMSLKQVQYPDAMKCLLSLSFRTSTCLATPWIRRRDWRTWRRFEL
jgi:hypothetical protein